MYLRYGAKNSQTSVFTLNNTKAKQQGSSLVLAIFVLVVMLLLGTALVRMLATSSQSVAYEVLGTRAYQAANIGAQQRLSMIFPVLGSAQRCGVPDPVTNRSSDNTVPNVLNTLGNVNGLKSCQVSALSCSDFVVDGTTYYRITASGQCTAGEVQTLRTIEVEARSL
ncbi:MSHA biogenesis protein MshP [Thalassotalea euphylliae]|uniref:MSHA biogenesis protein MshP n=1 Tax=Thalassotalea euphylliae TaxID=1655234 RepID=A0A3E0TUN2_9GAMM|nr:pilus assembly PilX N-terminal domain-containing protein [Thalassotalea euphylliae]REL28160.1 MSHA biogenesis protein MshP [Thalassotalea euphylliae]